MASQIGTPPGDGFGAALRAIEAAGRRTIEALDALLDAFELLVEELEPSDTPGFASGPVPHAKVAFLHACDQVRPPLTPPRPPEAA